MLLSLWLLKHLCNKLKRRFRVAVAVVAAVVVVAVAVAAAAGGAASGGRHADF